MSGKTQKLLFLCTGNYYRSRFAEEYFNQRAFELGLPWVSDSRGLAEHLDKREINFGPISVHALHFLQLYRVEARGVRRYPVTMEPAAFGSYSRIVALSRREHEPMVKARFPRQASRVEYFDVEDVGIELPEVAIPRLVDQLDRLIEVLQTSAVDSAR